MNNNNNKTMEPDFFPMEDCYRNDLFDLAEDLEDGYLKSAVFGVFNKDDLEVY